MSNAGLRLKPAELLRRPGTRRSLEGTARIEGIGLERLEVTADPEIEYRLVVESLPDGIVVTGSATGRWSAPCRRCLEPVTGSLDAKVREVFSSSLEREGATDVADVQPLTSDLLDLTQTVREAAVLALPLAPACDEDCRGPDPHRFPTGERSGEDDSQPRDPRWSVLDQLSLDQPGDDSHGRPSSAETG